MAISPAEHFPRITQKFCHLVSLFTSMVCVIVCALFDLIIVSFKCIGITTGSIRAADTIMLSFIERVGALTWRPDRSSVISRKCAWPRLSHSIKAFTTEESA